MPFIDGQSPNSLPDFHSMSLDELFEASEHWARHFRELSSTASNKPSKSRSLSTSHGLISSIQEEQYADKNEGIASSQQMILVEGMPIFRTTNLQNNVISADENELQNEFTGSDKLCLNENQKFETLDGSSWSKNHVEQPSISFSDDESYAYCNGIEANKNSLTSVADLSPSEKRENIDRLRAGNQNVSPQNYLNVDNTFGGWNKIDVKQEQNEDYQPKLRRINESGLPSMMQTTLAPLSSPPPPNAGTILSSCCCRRPCKCHCHRRVTTPLLATVNEEECGSSSAMNCFSGQKNFDNRQSVEPELTEQQQQHVTWKKFVDFKAEADEAQREIDDYNKESKWHQQQQKPAEEIVHMEAERPVMKLTFRRYRFVPAPESTV